jgi:pimeloyl-ACP methyl ester carboxylesterase
MFRKLVVSLAALATALSAVAAHAEPAKNVVLVHGAFADGSGWKAVADILAADGYKVSILQEPETSLADDIAAARRVIAAQNGPTILVGHSYGGVIITEVGNDPKVQGLVYVAAFAPDAGETLGALNGRIPAVAHSIRPSEDGFLTIDPAAFAQDFAADLPARQAQFMALSQVPVSGRIFGTPISNAAWRGKPSWYAVATEDRMINPDLERFMAKRAGSKTVEIRGSHAIFASQPRAVARLIEDAAKGAN